MPTTAPPDLAAPASASVALPVAPLLRASAAFCALFVSMAVMSPTLDALVRTPFALDNEHTARFMQASALAGLVAGLVMGWVADWMGRRVPMLVGALVASGVLTALFPHVGDFRALLTLRFFEGFATATALMLVMARAADLATPASRPRVMAILMSAVPMGYLLGQPMAAALGGISLGLLFGAVGGLLVVAGLVMATDVGAERCVERAPASLASTLATLGQLPRAWLPILISTTDKFTVAALAVALPLMLKDRLSLDPIAWTSALMAIYWLAFLVAAWPAGRLGAAWGLGSTSLWALVAYGVVLAAVANAGLGGTMALMGALGVLTAFQFVPNMALLGECAAPHQRATFMAASNMMGSLGMIAGFAVVGALSDASYALAFLVTGLVAIVAGAVGIVLSSALQGMGGWRNNAVAGLAEPALVPLSAKAPSVDVGK